MLSKYARNSAIASCAVWGWSGSVRYSANASWEVFAIPDDVQQSCNASRSQWKVFADQGANQLPHPGFARNYSYVVNSKMILVDIKLAESWIRLFHSIWLAKKAIRAIAQVSQRPSSQKERSLTTSRIALKLRGRRKNLLCLLPEKHDIRASC